MPKQSHAICGAKKRNGKPCKSKQMANGRCRMHGGTNPGAPAKNQNARKHGLFAQSLNPTGLEVYKRALDEAPETLAKDSAAFLAAQIAQAFEYRPELEEAKGVVGRFLRTQVQQGAMNPKLAEAILEKLSIPDIGTLGKALGPMKGLLEVKKASDGEQSDSSLDALMDALAESRKVAREGQ